MILSILADKLASTDTNSELKRKLAQQFPYDVESYINGKERLVLEIERQAMQWHLGDHKSV